MTTSQVYFCNMRTLAGGMSIPEKLKNLIREGGIAKLDLKGQVCGDKNALRRAGQHCLPSSAVSRRSCRGGQGVRRQTFFVRLQHYVHGHEAQRVGSPSRGGDRRL